MDNQSEQKTYQNTPAAATEPEKTVVQASETPSQHENTVPQPESTTAQPEMPAAQLEPTSKPQEQQPAAQAEVKAPEPAAQQNPETNEEPKEETQAPPAAAAAEVAVIAPEKASEEEHKSKRDNIVSTQNSAVVVNQNNPPENLQEIAQVSHDNAGVINQPAVVDRNVDYSAKAQDSKDRLAPSSELNASSAPNSQDIQVPGNSSSQENSLPSIKLFVGGLYYQTEEDVYNFFKQYCEIVD